MPLRTAVRLSLFIAVLALPADAFGAAVIRTSSVTGRVVAPAGRAGTLSLACPPGAVALNAAVTRKGGGATVRRSIPGKGAGDWAFRVAGAAGSGSRSVSAVLRCMWLRLPEDFTRARLNVNTRTRSGLDLGPGEARTVRAGCGRAWTATGYALDAGRSGDVRLRAAVPDAHGWRFTLENSGSGAALARVSARCLASNVTARRSGGGSAEMRFGVTRRSFTRAFQSGPARRTVTGSCGGNRFNLSAGLEIDAAHPMVLRTASPVRSRGARWSFADVAAGDAFRGFMVCLSRRAVFR